MGQHPFLVRLGLAASAANTVISAVASKQKPRTRLRIYHGDHIALGPGKVELLARIAATGSISEAARQMSMSYNRAWLHIQDINKSFKTPLVTSLRGGNTGGGAGLTDAGQQVLELYQKLEAEAQAATEETWKQVQQLLRD